MELHKLKIGDIRGLEPAKLKETELEIRRELVKIRMDIYTAKNAHGAKVRGLRTNLARLMTIRTEKGLNNVPSKTAKAPAAPKVAKAPKAAAPKSAKAAAKVEKAPKAAAAAAAKPAKAKASKK